MPCMSEKTNSIKNIINKTLAIIALSPATPEKPRAPAIKARTKKTITQLSIIFSPY
jgi:hypothetical protein